MDKLRKRKLGSNLRLAKEFDEERRKLGQTTIEWLGGRIPGGGRSYPKTRKYEAGSRKGVGGRKQGTKSKEAKKSKMTAGITAFFSTTRAPIKDTEERQGEQKMKTTSLTSPASQSGRSYYRNAHRSSELWSCAIDVVVEIFCSLFSHPVLKEQFISSTDSLILSLVEIARDRESDVIKPPSTELLDKFWNSVLAKYPNTGMPKGTAHAKIDDIMHHIVGEFGRIKLEYSSKCEICERTFSSIPYFIEEALWLLDGIPVQNANGDLSSAIKNSLIEKAGMNARRSRRCCQGTGEDGTKRERNVLLDEEKEVCQTNSDVLILQLDVRSNRGKSCNDYKTPLQLPETLILGQETFQLFGAALHVPSHHMSIVRYGGEFFFLDDLAADGLANPYPSFSAAAAARDRTLAQCSGTFLLENREFAVNFAVYAKIDPDTNKDILKKSSEILSQSTSPPPTTVPAESTSQADAVISMIASTSRSESQSEEVEMEEEQEGLSMGPGESIEETAGNGRSFKLEFWQKKFTWLYQNFSEGGYKCKDCEIFGVAERGHGHKWITEPVKSLGSHAGRILRSHESSGKHIKAIKKKTTSREMFLLETYRQKNLSKEETEAKKRAAVIQLIKIVVFMVKKKWALMNNFGDLVQFVSQELEDKVLQAFLNESPSNAQYTSNYSVQEFINAVSTWIQRQTLEQVSRASMYAMIMDEATDEANRENMALFIRKVDAGKIVVVFLCILRITDKSAKGLFKAIENYCNENNIDLKRCAFVGMDTTSVMSGVRGGLQVYFKQANPHCIYVKCRNHLLALPFKHLEKGHRVMERFVSFILHLWKVFEDSTLRSDDLEKTYRAHGYQPLRMIKAIVTRWLSIGPACARHCNYYEVHLDTFDQILTRKFDTTVQGVRDEACNSDMVFVTGLLADVTFYTTKIQTILQEKTLTFTKIPSLKMEILDAIQRMIDNPCLDDCHCPRQAEKQTLRRIDGEHEELHGCHLSRVAHRLEIAKARSELVRRARSQTLTGQLQVEGLMKTLGIPILRDLKRELEDALSIDEQLNGLCCFDGENLPRSEDDLEMEALTDTIEFYGKVQQKGAVMSFPKINESEAKAEVPAVLKTLVGWKADFNRDIEHQKQECGRKLSALKRKKLNMISASKAKAPEKVKSIQKVENNIKAARQSSLDIEHSTFGLKELLAKWETSGEKQIYTQCNTLIKLASLVPGSVAEVERGWSVMGLVSTPLRSRLTSDNLKKLMRITLFTGDFVWEDILKIWMESPRRIDIGEPDED